MSIKIYLTIMVPITYLFIYGLVRTNIPVVVASGIAGLVLSQWGKKGLRN